MGSFSITQKEGCCAQIKITKAPGNEVPWGSITKHYTGNGNSVVFLYVCSDLYTLIEKFCFFPHNCVYYKGILTLEFGCHVSCPHSRNGSPFHMVFQAQSPRVGPKWRFDQHLMSG